MSKDKVTGFFVEVARFCKAFDREIKRHPIESNKPGDRSIEKITTGRFGDDERFDTIPVGSV